jgi:hypothetical protein
MERTDFNQIEAELIGYKVFELLNREYSTLKSHSVFDHAIYMHDDEDNFIKIIKDKEFVSPTSIVISGMDNLSFKSMDIQEGTQIEFIKDKITSKEGEFSLSFGNALTWQLPKFPKESEIISLEQINLNLRILKDIIYTSLSREGLVPLLENVEKLGPLEVFVKNQMPTMSEKARPYIDALMWGILSGDIETIKSSAGSILGLGPGLTPSCDDFIAGLILSLNTASTSLCKNEPEAVEFFEKMSEELAALAKEKTTIYSSWFISESAMGEGPKAALELIFSIISNSPEKVSALSKELISVGATSGADTAIGIYYGIRFLTSRLELSDLNEFE